MTSIRAHVEIDAVSHPVGRLHSTVRRGTVSSVFTYDGSYVALRGAYAMEPALPLTAGAWPVGRAIPRAFSDAAPDRWGRNLITKRRRAEAAEAGEVAPTLDDRDYLLGVSDLTRQGALRFTVESNEIYQHPSLDVPKLIALPSLMRAAESVATSDVDDSAAVKALLDAGTGSLGGARPKASVRENERLMIAKFSHPGDEWNVIAWEATALQLAARAGIDVPRSRLLTIEGQFVLLLERFDRNGAQRIGYISAMTMLEADEGESRDYLELAETLVDFSANPTGDLRELWKRIAFSIAIHNTDDHLRNHGFLRERSGWRLSPAFDVNPNPEPGQPRVTSVAGAVSPADEVSSLLAFAPQFELSEQQARATLSEVVAAVSEWASVAHRSGVSEREIVLFEPSMRQSLAAVHSGI